MNETKFNKGALISRNSVVELASLIRDINFSSINVTVASKNHAIVLKCPIISVPLANVTWYFNKSLVKFEMGLNQENRRVKYYLHFLKGFCS